MIVCDQKSVQTNFCKNVKIDVIYSTLYAVGIVEEFLLKWGYRFDNIGYIKIFYYIKGQTKQKWIWNGFLLNLLITIH